MRTRRYRLAYQTIADARCLSAPASCAEAAACQCDASDAMEWAREHTRRTGHKTEVRPVYTYTAKGARP